MEGGGGGGGAGAPGITSIFYSAKVCNSFESLHLGLDFVILCSIFAKWSKFRAFLEVRKYWTHGICKNTISHMTACDP